jgi:hypothetical protein
MLRSMPERLLAFSGLCRWSVVSAGSSGPRKVERVPGPARAGRCVRPCVAYGNERSNASGLRSRPAVVFDLVLPMQTKGRTLGNIPVVSGSREQTRAPRATTLLTQPPAPIAQPQTGRPTPGGPGSRRPPGAPPPPFSAAASIPSRRLSGLGQQDVQGSRRRSRRLGGGSVARGLARPCPLITRGGHHWRVSGVVAQPARVARRSSVGAGAVLRRHDLTRGAGPSLSDIGARAIASICWSSPAPTEPVDGLLKGLPLQAAVAARALRRALG